MYVVEVSASLDPLFCENANGYHVQIKQYRTREVLGRYRNVPSADSGRKGYYTEGL